MASSSGKQGKDIFAIQRLVSRSFRKHGLTVRADASKAVVEFMKSSQEKYPERALDDTLSDLIARVKDQHLKQTFVTLELVESCVKEIARHNASKSTNLIMVLDSLSFPRFIYQPVTKTYLPAPPGHHSRHGRAGDKAAMFRARFECQYQQLLRNDLFAPPPISSGPASRKEYFAITDIESLVGSPGRKCVFGMLTSLVEKKVHLEDLASNVELDLSKAQLTSGLFVDGAFVLCEGELQDGIFKVETMGFSPPEARQETLKTYPHLALCGVDLKGHDRDKERARLADVLKTRENDMVVILSQIHLDRPEIINKLRTLFKGMEPARPPLFILTGNFTSRPFGTSPEDRRQYIACMDALADLIAEFPTINKSARFLIVPGPNDPGVGNVLPRPGLAKHFTTRLRDKVNKLVLGSNPCRVLYMGQEIVLFREDLLHKMRRNCLIEPSEDETDDLAEHLTKTIVDQCHLCPLPPVVRPIYWNLDHAMRLYPLPDLLILADTVDQFEVNYEGVKALNPGTFSSDFSFLIYYPASGKVEFSRIDIEL